MKLFEKDHQPPTVEPGSGDSAYALVKAASGAVPILGPVAQYFLDTVLMPPLARRQQEWMEEIAESIRKLESAKFVTYDQLRASDKFLDCVASATQVAIRTSDPDKLTALKAAVANSALMPSMDSAFQQVFISLIDRFTAWHLAVLRIFQNPKIWRTEDGRTLNGLPVSIDTDAAKLIEHAYPELRLRPYFYELVWAELAAAGLVENNPLGLHNKGEGDSVKRKRSAPFGDDFLRFIETPEYLRTAAATEAEAARKRNEAV